MMRASVGIRGRALVVAGALAVLLGLAIALADAQGDAPSEHPAERMVLRLHDLPPGFVQLGGFNCEPLRPAEPPREVADFVERFSPKGCFGTYQRLYEVPGVASPAIAGTGAMDTGSVEGAAAGFAVAPQLLGDLTEKGAKVAPVAEAIGEATQLLHWKDLPSLTGEEGQRGTFVVWRWGTVVAATFAAADSFALADRIALDLARRQQAHVENPTPYTVAERYAIDVPLDNPRLEVPVRWLGRTFSPGHGLRTARLAAAFEITRPGRQSFHLGYTRGINLDGRTEDDWDTRQDGMPRWAWRCTRSRKLALPRGGNAVIYASYRRNLSECPARPPREYSALVHVGGTVLVVGRRICATCLGNTISAGEYNSLAGMKAIVRGLQPRPEPVYAPAHP
jgi:hypothetical protein